MQLVHQDLLMERVFSQGTPGEGGFPKLPRREESVSLALSSNEEEKTRY